MELVKLFKKGGYKLTDKSEAKFSRYYELLDEWNKKFNLTRITDEYDVALKHFYDSVTGLKYIPDGSSILDIGSGAGLPAIPIAIMKPDSKVTMVEATGKKTEFLETVVKELNLNADVLNIRIEDFKDKESFDIVTARAVAPMVTLVEYALPFVKMGGKFIAYKSVNAQIETDEARRAINILGGAITKTNVFTLPDSDIVRALVVISKIKRTPDGYPRGAGKPKHRPLGN